jgi:hypothetical protein
MAAVVIQISFSGTQFLSRFEMDPLYSKLFPIRRNVSLIYF